MHKVTLYTTHCAKCRVLERKLLDAKIEFETVTDTDKMIEMGMTTAPALVVDNSIMTFSEAYDWVRERMNEV